MVQQVNDDLFEGTKMTFGEHLEELRVALFRGVLGLFGGFIIGLFFASNVVQWIQTPLRNALDEFYVDRAFAQLQETYGEELDPEIKKFLATHNVTYEEVLFEKSELAALFSGETVEQPALTLDRNLPLPDTSSMVKTRIWRPLRTKITTLNAQEAFMIWIKAGFVAGMLIASPYILWQLWIFVAAGLYPHEKRYVHLFLPISLALFWSGAALAFFVVFRYVLNFLLSFNNALDIETEPRISEWMSFVLMLPLGFGIAFQLPLVMLFLQRIGIFSIDAYLDKWRIAVLVIFVISMLLTPADPISMLLMAMPLTGLYFLGVGMCKWMPRGRNPFSEAYDPN